VGGLVTGPTEVTEPRMTGARLVLPTPGFGSLVSPGGAWNGFVAAPGVCNEVLLASLLLEDSMPLETYCEPVQALRLRESELTLNKLSEAEYWSMKGLMPWRKNVDWDSPGEVRYQNEGSHLMLSNFETGKNLDIWSVTVDE